MCPSETSPPRAPLAAESATELLLILRSHGFKQIHSSVNMSTVLEFKSEQDGYKTTFLVNLYWDNKDSEIFMLCIT